MIICKTYKDTETKTHKKAKKTKTQESKSALNFINIEDEVFLKVRAETSYYYDVVSLIYGNTERGVASYAHISGTCFTTLCVGGWGIWRN